MRGDGVGGGDLGDEVKVGEDGAEIEKLIQSYLVHRRGNLVPGPIAAVTNTLPIQPGNQVPFKITNSPAK